MILNVPDDVGRRLRAAADARGLSVDAFAAEVLGDALREEPAERPRRHLSFAKIGASEGGISHRMDDLLADGFGRD
jgi:plasmid stability protein